MTSQRAQKSSEIERCRCEITAIEAQIRGGHPDLEGLCLALADWSGELRLLQGSNEAPETAGSAPVCAPLPAAGLVTPQDTAGRDTRLTEC
jgi:hypothetical protein